MMAIAGTPVPTPVDIIMVPAGTAVTIPAGTPSLVIAEQDPELTTESRLVDSMTGIPAERDYPLDTRHETRFVITLPWKEAESGR